MISDILNFLKRKFQEATLETPNSIIIFSTPEFDYFAYKLSYVENLNVYTNMQYNKTIFVSTKEVKKDYSNIFGFDNPGIIHVNGYFRKDSIPIGIYALGNGELFVDSSLINKLDEDKIKLLEKQLIYEKKQFDGKKEIFKSILLQEKLKNEEN